MALDIFGNLQISTFIVSILICFVVALPRQSVEKHFELH